MIDMDALADEIVQAAVEWADGAPGQLRKAEEILGRSRILGRADMIVVVTWESHEVRQADILVPNDASPEEITRLASERAEQGGGELYSEKQFSNMHWRVDNLPVIKIPRRTLSS